MNILIIEDDVKQAKNVSDILLSIPDYEVFVCYSIEEALDKVDFFKFDFLILDLMLAGESGDHLVKLLRKKSINIPILILSAITQSEVKTDLLNMGVDDFINKPVDGQELIARVNAIARRYSKHNPLKKLGANTFNLKENKIINNGKSILLTNTECKLLNMFLEEKGKVVKTVDILKKIWGIKPGYHSNVVQATVTRLRKKIDTLPDNLKITSVHGVGYVLNIK